MWEDHRWEKNPSNTRRENLCSQPSGLSTHQHELAPAWYTSPLSRKASGGCFSFLGNQWALWDMWNTYSPAENVIPASYHQNWADYSWRLLFLFFFKTGISLLVEDSCITMVSDLLVHLQWPAFRKVCGFFKISFFFTLIIFFLLPSPLILNRSRVKTLNPLFFSFLFFLMDESRMAFCYSLVNSNKIIYSLIRKIINQQTEKCGKMLFKGYFPYLKVIGLFFDSVSCFFVFFNLKGMTKQSAPKIFWVAIAEAWNLLMVRCHRNQ